MSGGVGEREMTAASQNRLANDGPFEPAARSEGAARAAGTFPMLWVNGDRVESDALQISALDRGFTLADGIFETMLLRRGEIFRVARHFARLARGASVLRIDLPRDVARWLERAAREAARVSRAAALRLTVSRGAGPPGLAPRGEAPPTVVIAASTLPGFPPALYERGLSAVTADARRDERASTAGIKSLAYTEAIVALMRARDAGADEAIFLDTEGHISEASASNLFVVHDGALVTPPLSCGVLPGITREAVMELAMALGAEVIERPVEPRDLAAAHEAFLTSSLRGVAPLVRVDGRVMGAGAVGPLTRELLRAYDALVERECQPAASHRGDAASATSEEDGAGAPTASERAR